MTASFSFGLIMEQLLTWFHAAVGALSHGDKLASAGVTMWILTITGVLLRRVPRLIFVKIKSRIIVRMTMNKTGTGADMDSRNFLQFLLFVARRPSFRFDRNRKPVFGANSVKYTPGIGFHWFWYEGRYYWFYLKEIDSQGIEGQKEQINLYTFGMSLKPLEAITEKFRIKQDAHVLNIWIPNHRMGNGNGSSWAIGGTINTKYHPEPIVNDNIQVEVFDRVQDFIDKKEWYLRKGLAYKITFMFMGPPGTGKTSLAREIAIKFDLRFHAINLATVGQSLNTVIASMKQGGILLIDDFEDVPTLQNRLGEDQSQVSRENHITLSSFLGILDGAIPLDNLIVILNTNHPQKLDPAIYRPGRVDHKVLLGPLDADKVVLYINRMYDVEHTGRAEPTVVAALASIFNRNKHNYEGFVSDYTRYLDGELILDELEFDGSKPTGLLPIVN